MKNSVTINSCLFLVIVLLMISTSVATSQDTSDGIVWMPPVQLSPDSDKYAGGGSIAAQGDTIHITWTTGRLKFPYLRSANGGRSFEPLRELLPDSLGIVNPCWLISAGKRLHGLFMYSINHGTNYYLYSMFSDNAGATWSLPKIIPSNVFIWSYAARGDTVVLMHSSQKPVLYTTDGGESWIQAAGEIRGAGPYITLNKGIVHLVKGVTYQIPGYPPGTLQYKRSTDLGNTWTDSTWLTSPDFSGVPDASISSDPSTDSSALLVVLDDDGAVATWSFDNGATWQPFIRPGGMPGGSFIRTVVRGNTWAVSCNPGDKAMITLSTNSGQTWTTSYQLKSGAIINQPALSEDAVHAVMEDVTGINETARMFIVYRRGIILSAQHPRYSIATKKILFEETKVSCSTIIPVVVKNTGGAILDIQSVVSDDSNFTVAPANGTINSYDSLTFLVTFAPTSPGAKSGKVIFTHNAQSASDGSPDTVDVSGIGTTSDIMSVGPKILSFEETTIACRTMMPITVKNNFCTSLVVESEVLDDSNFTVTPINAAINPTDSVTFIVMFQPANAGAKSARIIFTHNMEGSPDTISVTGTGTGSSATAVITNYYGNDWQLISLPVQVLCPYTASNLFTYTSSYERKDTMVEGAGYWQKLSTLTLRFVGFSMTDDTI